jgi:hypothetical protein
MKPFLRRLLWVGGASLLLGGDCTFGRPIVDQRSRYYPSDGVISCTGTRCESLPAYELTLPAPLAHSPCAEELATTDLGKAAKAVTSLAGMRYVLASERPLELNLSTLDIRDACIVLSGPVRLTLGANSRLSNVTVLLGPAASSDDDENLKPSSGATPNLYLGHAELEHVVLESIAQGEPSGSAQIEFSTCLQCETRIDALTVTESQMQNSRLGARSLNMVGGAFDTVELTFEYGLLAGVVANNMRTATCNTLSLVGATIAGRASQIGPCDCTVANAGQTPDAGELADAGESSDASPPDASEADANEADAGLLDAAASDASEADAGEPDAAAAPDADEPDAGQTNAACNGATLSQTTVLGGMIDGKVRAENSTFRSVLFARHAPTSLDVWTTDIELSVSCDQPIDIRMDKTSGIGCTSCDSAETASACRLDNAPKLIVNHCKSFAGPLPACEPPLPARRTPYIPMPPKLGP